VTIAPELSRSTKPKYLAIADALVREIEEGRLEAGSRRPTHRALADQLGVTVGTITRASKEVYSRGLVVGEIGRGPFLRRRQAHEVAFAIRETKTIGVTDLSLNLPKQGVGTEVITRALTKLLKHGTSH
jgi:DNA-binding GntR family transcriptional regulator